MNLEAYLMMAELEEEHWWFSGKRAIASDIIHQFHLPQQAKILDIGCGTGGNLSMLSQYGQVMGIESNELSRRIAQQKHANKFEIHPGTMPGDLHLFANQTFDLICLFDVLEHIEQEIDTLKSIQRVMKPDARLFITVPAYCWLWSIQDHIHQHKRRYHATSLRKAGLNAGLFPERISYYNTLLAPLGIIARLLDKLFKNKKSTGMKLPNQFINTAFYQILTSERYLLRKINLLFGMSLIAVFRKQIT
jgi:2-polyprenyl-3-methyl-5-hydroxy-6-metoxy-1,4-benzoquinol methylase